MALATTATVQLDKKRRAYVCGTKVLQGLHRFMDHNWWPNWSYDKVKRCNKQKANKPTAQSKYATFVDHLERFKKATKSPRMVGSDGRKIGVRARRGRGGSAKAKKRGGGVQRQGLLTGALIAQQLVRLLCEPAPASGVSQVDPLTYRCLAFLKNHGFEPETAEYAVGCLQPRVGTGIDLVARDKATNQLAAFEIKTGFENYWERGHAYMKAPFSDVWNSPANKAQVQLAATLWLARHTPGGRAIEFSFGAVLLLQADSVQMFPLEDWAWSRMDDAMAAATLA